MRAPDLVAHEGPLPLADPASGRISSAEPSQFAGNTLVDQAGSSIETTSGPENRSFLFRYGPAGLLHLRTRKLLPPTELGLRVSWLAL